MHDAVLVGAVLHLTGLGISYCACHVGGNRTHLWVRHQTTRTENLSQLTDDTHRIRGRNHHVEIHLSSLDAFGQIVETDDVCTCGLGFLSLGTLGKYGHAHSLAGTFGQHDGTAHQLVGFLGVDAKIHGYIYRLIKFCLGSFFHQSQGLCQRIQFIAVYLGSQRLITLGNVCHVIRPPR